MGTRAEIIENFLRMKKNIIGMKFDSNQIAQNVFKNLALTIKYNDMVDKISILHTGNIIYLMNRKKIRLYKYK